MTHTGRNHGKELTEDRKAPLYQTRVRQRIDNRGGMRVMSYNRETLHDGESGDMRVDISCIAACTVVHSLAKQLKVYQIPDATFQTLFRLI